MRRAPVLTVVPLVCALSAAACSGRKSQDAPASASVSAPAGVDGLDALPGDARVVVGVSLEGLAGSALARRALKEAFASDPTATARFEALAHRCELDPSRQIESVLVAAGIPAEPDGLVMVARGRLDEAKLVGCLRGILGEQGGKVEDRRVGGARAYVATIPVGPEGDSEEPGRVWFAFGGPETLILATSEPLLARARDPRAPKLAASAAMKPLLDKTGSRHVVWAAGLLPPDWAALVAGAAHGAVKEGPTGAYGWLDLASGLSLEIGVEMKSDADARALVEAGVARLDDLAALAQARGMGRLAGKIRLEPRGRTAWLGLTLNADELGELEAQLTDGRQGTAQGIAQGIRKNTEGATP